MGRNRRDEIFDFCYDLGLLWSECPDLRFGEIAAALVEWHENKLAYISDPECLDLIREFFKGE